MRKHIRNQLLEILSTVWEGVKYVKSNRNSAENVLADCYSAVSTVCETLESGLSSERFAEYNESLSLLKAMLEFMFDSVSGDKPVSEVSKDIKEQIQLLKKELKTESEVRLEIAFFPYKASMWDSLESIWLAAENDPGCDAYVVAIPYYAKKPDGTLGEMHYEGNEYPDYVPITDWKKYNVSSRHPDVIFFHNGYDGNNLITCVHPDYYSSKLRNCTDLLCYVPYFVSGETVTEHFCNIPGCFHSHKVFVQSDLIKTNYIRSIKNIAGNSQESAENKYIALGSPKIDKVVRSKREDFDIPPEWKQLIIKPDGTYKKILLYNTSPSALLRENERYLIKLCSVLETFRKRDDVVLWWRPHPLTNTLYGSMRPSLANGYKKIINEYKRQAWGIFDESSDLHRAITWTDAYYGSSSSIIWMYNLTGKPVFIQNSFITENNNRHRAELYDFKIKDNKIWGVTKDSTGLFSIDINTHNLTYHRLNPDESPLGSYSRISLDINDDSIVIAPYNQNSIIIYNTEKDTVESVSVKLPGQHKFADVYINNGIAYLIPSLYPALLKFSLITGEINENVKICADLDLRKKSGDRHYFIKGCGTVNGNILILASGINNIIVKLNTVTGKYSFHHIGDYPDKYISVIFAKGNYWLLSYQNGIVKWNEETDTVTVLNKLPENFKHGGLIDFRCSVLFESYIFVFPNHSNMILKIDTRTNEIDSFINLADRKPCPEFNYGKSKYSCAESQCDYIYAFSAYENCLQKINPRTGDIENIPLLLSDEYYENISNQPLFNPPGKEKSEPWKSIENGDINLPLFLERLKTEKINKEQILLDGIQKYLGIIDGSSGDKIYNYVKDKCT